MAFNIIELKQELVETADSLNTDDQLKTVKSAFDSFITSEAFLTMDIGYRTELNQALAAIETTLINEIQRNNTIAKKLVKEDAAIIAKSPPTFFSVLPSLQNMENTLTPELKDEFESLVKTVTHCLKVYTFLDNQQAQLAEAMKQFDYNNDAALLKFFDNLKTVTKTDLITFSADKNITAFIDAVQSFEILKQLADAYQQDKRPLAEKIIPLQEFLEARWGWLQNKSHSYCADPENKLNQLCLELAAALAETAPELGRFRLLMPTVNTIRSPVTLSYFDDPALELKHIILSDDSKNFVELETCFMGAEEEGVYKHTNLIAGEVFALTDNEKMRLTNHSSHTRKYAQAIQKLREVTTGSEQDKQLLSLAQSFAESTTQRSETYAKLGLEKFQEYLDSLSDEEKEKLLSRIPSSEYHQNYGELRSIIPMLSTNIAQRTYMGVNTIIQYYVNLSMGARMQRLAESLKAGGVDNADYNLSAHDHRRADHQNAGEAANLGILEFSAYLELLSEEDKKYMFSLSHGKFGELWSRLSTPNAVNLRDTRYCVELISPKIIYILRDHPELYTKSNVDIKKFQDELTAARNNFSQNLNAATYKIDVEKASYKFVTHEDILDFIPIYHKFETSYNFMNMLLQLHSDYYSKRPYNNSQTYLRNNQEHSNFLTLAVNFRPFSLNLRYKQFRQKLHTFLIPIYKFFGDGILNNTSYGRYFPYRFDATGYNTAQGGGNEAKPGKRFDFSWDKVTLTRALCAAAYTVISIVPYLVVQACSSLVNALLGKPWNSSFENPSKPKQWNNLSDLGPLGEVCIAPVIGLAIAISFGVAALSTGVLAVGYSAISLFEIAALPVVGVASVVAEMGAWIGSKLGISKPAVISKVTAGEPAIGNEFGVNQKNIRRRLNAQAVYRLDADTTIRRPSRSESFSDSQGASQFWKKEPDSRRGSVSVANDDRIEPPKPQQKG